MRQYCVIVSELATHMYRVTNTQFQCCLHPGLIPSIAILGQLSFSHLPITVNCTGFFMRKSNVERNTSHMYRPSCSRFTLTILPPTSALELGVFQVMLLEDSVVLTMQVRVVLLWSRPY